MYKVLLLLILAIAAAEQQYDYGANQLLAFKNKTKNPATLTLNAGMPVDYKDATSSLNRELITHDQFMETMMQFSRESIPERTGHAQGTGAFGYFVVTHDVTHICKAHFLGKIGRRTSVVARFSTSTFSKGASEMVRETRGMGVKFCTKEGVFDWTSLNTPMFSIRDAMQLPSLVHAQKVNPVTNLPDPNSAVDFMTLVPEGIFKFLYTMSDIGMPYSYRFMPAHAVHTHVLYNSNGTRSNCKMHLIPKQGIVNMNDTEFNRLKVEDPMHFTRDLYNAIENGEYPVWQLKFQCYSDEELEKVDFDPWDATCIAPWDESKIITVGDLVLNRNPENYHKDIEFVTFGPANLVPGFCGSPESLYKGRSYSYRDAHLSRLGVNFEKQQICSVQKKVFSYNRNGLPYVGDNGKSMPWYYPNSFNGPVPYHEKNRPSLPVIHEREYGEVPTNFKQATNFYEKELTPEQQKTVIKNIVAKLKPCEKFLQHRMVQYFEKISRTLAEKVQEKLNL